MKWLLQFGHGQIGDPGIGELRGLLNTGWSDPELGREHRMTSGPHLPMSELRPPVWEAHNLYVLQYKL